MSNHNAGEIPAHRKPKGSLAMAIIQGLGGPKGKPRGVPDGQPVNIPALVYYFLTVTDASSMGALLDLRLCLEGQPKGRMKSGFRFRQPV